MFSKKLIFISLVIFFAICSKSYALGRVFKLIIEADYSWWTNLNLIPSTEMSIVLLFVTPISLWFAISGQKGASEIIPRLIIYFPLALGISIGLYKLILKPIFLFIVLEIIINNYREHGILGSIGLWLALLFFIGIFIDWCIDKVKKDKN